MSGMAGIALLALLVVVEVRRPDSLIHLRLLSDRMFRNGIITMFMAFGVMLGVLYLLPLFLQQLVGLSAFDSGLTTFPQAVAIIVMAPVTSRLYRRVGPRRMIATGLLALSVTSGLFLLVDLQTNLWWIRAIMFLRGTSMSLAAVSAQAATFARITSQETGRASSLFNTSRQVASSFGVAVLSTALTEALLLRGMSTEGALQAFHDAFAVSIVFGLVGIFFALRIHDEDAAATFDASARVEHRPIAALTPALTARAISQEP